MVWTLRIMAAVTAVIGSLTLVTSTSALQENVAVSFLIESAVLLVGACIVQAIRRAEETIRAEVERTGRLIAYRPERAPAPVSGQLRATSQRGRVRQGDDGTADPAPEGQ